jgi:hypothetical protein
MLERDLFILMGLGGLFVVFGIVLLVWGRREEKGYFNAISARPDVREYLEHEPERPEPGGLKVGGWIAIAVGLLLTLIGGAFWLWG